LCGEIYWLIINQFLAFLFKTKKAAFLNAVPVTFEPL
jgi:hypothetical protein